MQTCHKVTAYAKDGSSRFQALCALACSWSLDLGVIEGRGGFVVLCLPPFRLRGSSGRWGLFSRQCEGRGVGPGDRETDEVDLSHLVFLGIWLLQVLRVAGWLVSFKERIAFLFLG